MAAENNGIRALLTLQRELSEHLDEHDRQIRQIDEKEAAGKRAIEADYARRESDDDRLHKQETAEAKRRLDSWNKKVAGYRSRVSKQRTNFVSSLCLAAPQEALGANPTYKKAVDGLLEESARLTRRRRADDNARLYELVESEQSIHKKFVEQAARLEKAAAAQHDAEVRAAQSKRATLHTQSQKARGSAITAAEAQHDADIAKANNQFVDRVEDELRPEQAEEIYRQVLQAVPEYDTFQPAKEFPAAVRFGIAGYDVSRHGSDPVKGAVLQKRFGFALGKANGLSYLKVPYGYSFADEKFSTLFEYDDGTRAAAVQNLQTVVLQLFMAVPCGKARFTFIDPVDLGNTFAMFSPLGEVDERIIDTRIWSDEGRIEERLQVIIDHTTDVIQRCLQGRYADIIEYNRSAGKNAEPLRFLVAMDFPKHFSDRSLDMLESIISNGPRTGVYTLIAANKADLEAAEPGSALQRICEKMNCLPCEGGIFYTSESTQEGPTRYFPADPPTDEQMQRTIDILRRGIRESEKIVITYDDASGGLLQKPDYWFRYSAQNGISVPIGLEGANKPVMLELGGVNKGGKKRPFHAMVAGTIGSGKSSLLHTIIMSILLHYSPEDVQLYLLDFKRGIEFKCYADAGLANFRTVAIDTEPEFGLAVLRDLQKEEERRGARFREEGVDRIEAYRDAMAARGVAHHGMPRMVVIFDEYQELFRDADSDVTKECAYLLSQVVLQAGSAMGMHMILSTQDVSNVKGLDPAIYGQFETRIALKCNEATSKTILNGDNEAGNQLVTADAGQAVFNDAAGHKDYNHMFRGAFITPDERRALLADIHDRQAEMPDLPASTPRLLLSSVQDDAQNLLNSFAGGMGVSDSMDPSYHLYIGESLSMVNTFYPALWSRAGQNLLLAGKNQDKARMICAFSALSLIYETIRLEGAIREPVITLFDFSGNTTFANQQGDLLGTICRQLPEAFRLYGRDEVVEGVQALAGELQYRRRHFVIFFGLNRARRLLSTGYERSPKAMLAELLRKGPENNMNFIVWANDPTMFLQNYGDTLEAFEHRLAFDMEDADFQAIVSEGAPKIISELNAIAFDMNDDNQKIRLYGMPTREWVDHFVENCRSYID